MQVTISARHGHINEDQQTLIREKVEKLLHFFERLTQIEVTVDLQKPEKNVEIIAHAEHKHRFVSHADHHDLLSSVNGAMEKIKQQIKHYKEKLQDHRHDPAHCGAQLKSPTE